MTGLDGRAGWLADHLQPDCRCKSCLSSRIWSEGPWNKAEGMADLGPARGRIWRAQGTLVWAWVRMCGVHLCKARGMLAGSGRATKWSRVFPNIGNPTPRLHIRHVAPALLRLKANSRTQGFLRRLSNALYNSLAFGTIATLCQALKHTLTKHRLKGRAACKAKSGSAQLPMWTGPFDWLCL